MPAHSDWEKNTIYNIILKNDPSFSDMFLFVSIEISSMKLTLNDQVRMTPSLCSHFSDGFQVFGIILLSPHFDHYALCRGEDTPAVRENMMFRK